jgi:hypothetical protein
MFNIKIIVVGYQSQEDEKGIVLDIVDNIFIAENRDNIYSENYAYADFLECIQDGESVIYEGKSYKIGDDFIFWEE